jgi:hypothetical protein
MPRGRLLARTAQGLLAALAVGSLAVGCSDGGSGGGGAPPSDPAPQADAASLEAQVLSRTGYGPDAWSRERIAEIGVDAYLEEQLDPASIPDDASDFRLSFFPSLTLSYHEILDRYETPSFEPFYELLHAKMVRAILSRRQLEQVLVDFWFDHFNVFGADGFSNRVVGVFERDAIRPHVLGSFEDMLRAVARNPAMLYYLDNFQSMKEGFVLDGKERGINENYSRELLELHTLGVDGGFDQDDVIEAARALTGWTFAPEQLGDPSGFYFRAEAHDDEAKSLLGTLHLPAGGGEQDGLDLITFLAAHPSTANLLCTKLVVRFVSEEPPVRGVDSCRDAYLDSGGDLKHVMRAILDSADFRSARNVGTKVKRPHVFLAGAARAMALPLTPEILDMLVSHAELMGEPLYQAHPPTGYPDASSHWASGGTLVSRFNYVSLFMADDVLVDWLLEDKLGISGGSAETIVDQLIETLFPGAVEETTRSLAIAHVEGLGGAPDAVRVREAATVLLASSDFMLH